MPFINVLAPLCNHYQGLHSLASRASPIKCCTRLLSSMSFVIDRNREMDFPIVSKATRSFCSVARVVHYQTLLPQIRPRYESVDVQLNSIYLGAKIERKWIQIQRLLDTKVIDVHLGKKYVSKEQQCPNQCFRCSGGPVSLNHSTLMNDCKVHIF